MTHSNQSAFDKVLSNLKAQKYRAVIDGDCKFTMIDQFGEEIKCAIGGLLTVKELEKLVKEERNDFSAVSLVRDGYAESIEKVSTGLIDSLQMCHDDIRNWDLNHCIDDEIMEDGFNKAGLDEMKLIAEKYKIKFRRT